MKCVNDSKANDLPPHLSYYISVHPAADTAASECLSSKAVESKLERGSNAAEQQDVPPKTAGLMQTYERYLRMG